MRCYKLYIIWFLVGMILVGFDLIPSWLEWANSVFLILAGCVVVGYAMETFGKKRGLIASILIGVATFTIEGMSAHFDIFFGSYDYTNRFPPLLFGVPIGIGFAWIVMIMAGHALTLSFKTRLVKALVAALYVVVLDLVLDPVAYVVKGYWLWDSESAYYGIPFSNFFGWFCIAFVVQLLLPRIKQLPSKQSIHRMNMVFWTIVVLFIWIALLAKLYMACIVAVISFSLLQIGRRFYNGAKKT